MSDVEGVSCISVHLTHGRSSANGGQRRHVATNTLLNMKLLTQGDLGERYMLLGTHAGRVM